MARTGGELSQRGAPPSGARRSAPTARAVLSLRRAPRARRLRRAPSGRGPHPRRAREGREVRAFRNACRHRGAEVASGTGCAKAFVCPFHGWTYGLDGRLKRVQHEQRLSGSRQEHTRSRPGPGPGTIRDRLRHPERAAERAGSRRGAPRPDRPRPGPDRHADNEVDVNWKVSVEGAIEGYHIRFGHPETFFPYGYDNLNVVEHCGRNSRVTFPFRRIEKLADVPAAERRIEGRVTYVYHLFPNALDHRPVSSHDPRRLRADRPGPNSERRLLPGAHRRRPGGRGDGEARRAAS